MRSRRSSGRFIVVEGLDGAGTTTQVERVASELRERELTVVVTREPSDGPVGTQIRQALTGRLSLPAGFSFDFVPTITLRPRAPIQMHVDTYKPASRARTVRQARAESI